MNYDIVEQLRHRACPAGLPHTGDDPQSDHGHTDCWLHHQAADEIERLRRLVAEWQFAAGDVLLNLEHLAHTANQEMK